MKKVVLAVLLGFVLCTAGVFAEHPGGWGIGIMGRGGYGWGSGGLGGAALSLKAPKVPVFWGVNLGLYSNYFGVGVTGDYYFIDHMIIPDIGLGWFFGAGGFFNFGSYNSGYDYNKWTTVSFGARLPIGLSWQFFRNSKIGFEIFGDVVPSLGLALRFWDSKYDSYQNAAGNNRLGVGGGFDFELGLRIWF
ncbi:MAG: DUF3996 domain-containing protein [Treponema sp.]|jgi:hypothetical protein|nr:DUF3996 domain-containing protein [Treponema sp.]